MIRLIAAFLIATVAACASDAVKARQVYATPIGPTLTGEPMGDALPQ